MGLLGGSKPAEVDFPELLRARPPTGPWTAPSPVGSALAGSRSSSGPGGCLTGGGWRGCVDSGKDSGAGGLGAATGNLRSSCWPETQGLSSGGPQWPHTPTWLGGGKQDSLVSRDHSVPQPSGPPPRPALRRPHQHVACPLGLLWLAAGQSALSPGISLLSLGPPDLTPSSHPEFMTKEDMQTNH